MKVKVEVGQVRVFLWAGSWSWWFERVPCECWNLYLGPFGLEVGDHG